MANFVKHEGCEHCGSHDALARYADSSAFCFSCGTFYPGDGSSAFKQEKPPISAIILPEGTSAPAGMRSVRGIPMEVLSKFGMVFDQDNAAVFPYYANTDDGTLVPFAYKTRPARSKEFYWTGKVKGINPLFGRQAAQSPWKLIITEGEFDAMAAYAMLGNKYSVVSIPSGARSAHNAIVSNLEWIEKFQAVYICFDMDEEGRTAAAQAMELLEPGLAYNVVLPKGYKDANDMLLDGADDQFQQAIYAAQPREVTGFVDDEALAEMALEFYYDDNRRLGLTTGFPTLDRFIGGWREGEVHTLISGTGVGKSHLSRLLLNHLLDNRVPCLYIPLEDLPEATPLQFVSFRLGYNVIKSREKMNRDELKALVLDVLRDLKIVTKWDYSNKDEIFSKIKHARKRWNTRFVVLDHITGLSQGTDGTSRETLEYLMPRLKQVAVDLGVTILLVSHISRDTQDKEDVKPSLSRIKDSTSIQQWSDDVIALSKPDGRNSLTTRLELLKYNRLWGRPEGDPFFYIQYDPHTTGVTEVVHYETETESESRDGLDWSDRDFDPEDESQEWVREDDYQRVPKSSQSVRTTSAELHTKLHTGLPAGVQGREPTDEAPSVRGGEGLLQSTRPDENASREGHEPRSNNMPVVPEREPESKQDSDLSSVGREARVSRRPQSRGHNPTGVVGHGTDIPQSVLDGAAAW